jgi:hypothetical protein
MNEDNIMDDIGIAWDDASVRAIVRLPAARSLFWCMSFGGAFWFAFVLRSLAVEALWFLLLLSFLVSFL